MSNQSKEILEFGPFRLEPAEALLTRDGAPVSIPPKVFDLLVYLVTHAGSLVEKEELLKALWPDSFVEEANLTVNIAALRRALGAQPDGSAWIETVPKRGYRFLGSITKVADPPEAAVSEPAPPPAATARRAYRRYLATAAAVLALAIAAFFVIRRPAAADRRQSIAVLPFQDLSTAADDFRAGLGMTDTLITKLGALPQLTVRPVANLLQVNTGDPLAAGRRLGVDTVLTGSVQRIDKRIRVSVRLLRVQDAQSLWADKFDEFYTNVFAVQDTISEKVAHVLALRLTSEDQERMQRRYTESTEAFRLYELGRYERLEKPDIAVGHFQEAIAADPRYALPWVDLAGIYLGRSGNGSEMYRVYAPKARQAGEAALRLAADLAEAHVAAADIKRIIDRDFAGSASELEIAMRLNRGSAKVHASRANMLAMQGDLNTALQEARIAVDLDPFNDGYAQELAWTLYCSRQYEAAVRWLDEFKQRDPREHIDWNRFYCYLRMSRVPEAISIMERALEAYATNRSIKAVLAHAYAVAGRKQDALALLSTIGNDWGFYQWAVIDLTFGDRTAALAHLNQAVDEHNVFVEWAKVDPDLEPLHGDPEFNRVLGRLGLTP
jgi:DNA-binding winged helix-turn-helix (wHTH) protein/TolB-like protein